VSAAFYVKKLWSALCAFVYLTDCGVPTLQRANVTPWLREMDLKSLHLQQDSNISHGQGPVLKFQRALIFIFS